ncbi:camp-dependent protein kinase [Aspergillus sclerotialis]|uniref:cAMP-dependent protein kinase n=1 Tax=Aspergillus sclerotialis TaxID=2070753 RepID=A0A3A2ZCN1_9EURO|nr:camp-dependent protein kinase [Aspergillus sclerotialis]
MPSLGGLLKKRRTKDSQGNSKELESNSNSSPAAAETQTSPVPAEVPANSSNSAQPQSSANNPHSSSSNAIQSSDPSATSMQHVVAQNQQATHSNSGHQHQQQNSNVASIQNIINAPQQDGAHGATGNNGQQNHQPQVIRSDARSTKGKYTLDDFTLQRTLGTGSFGRVHLVQSKHNHRFYAIKVLKKAQVVKMKQIEHTNDERRMLNRVRHPFLITLWGTWQDSRNLYMVMDFVEGGELFSLLRKSQRFPNPVAKFYAAEVTLAIEYLHAQQIIYRDLKPENLLLDRHGHLKITDFGFAKECPDITWTLCGTPDYLAPEVVSSKGYNKSVDWWSLGILIFEMLCGFTPFWDSGSPVKIYENILRGRVKYPPYLHPDAVDLLSQLITADLTKRLGNLHGGSEDVKNHPWFAEVTWDRLARKDIDAPYVPPIRGGQGDASQYDKYPEETESYGARGEDTHGHLFPDF